MVKKVVSWNHKLFASARIREIRDIFLRKRTYSRSFSCSWEVHVVDLFEFLTIFGHKLLLKNWIKLQTNSKIIHHLKAQLKIINCLRKKLWKKHMSLKNKWTLIAKRSINYKNNLKNSKKKIFKWRKKLDNNLCWK